MFAIVDWVNSSDRPSAGLNEVRISKSTGDSHRNYAVSHVLVTFSSSPTRHSSQDAERLVFTLMSKYII